MQDGSCECGIMLCYRKTCDGGGWEKDDILLLPHTEEYEDGDHDTRPCGGVHRWEALVLESH